MRLDSNMYDTAEYSIKLYEHREISELIVEIRYDEFPDEVRTVTGDNAIKVFCHLREILYLTSQD